jgi:2-polyprenyl-6-hydroxyphenyl methylase/3-demethylubiquinone-9 3-methyltransferase
MRTWVPDAKKILEVGCGEGAMTERITQTYPRAAVTAIDITPNVGRLFRGNASTVTFRQETVQDLARREPRAFDLIVLSDVLHHVPKDVRLALMSAIDQAMAPDGSLLFKDWIASSRPIHWLCDMSERYLTGDDVAYFTMEGFKTLVTDTFGPDAIRKTGTVKPWRNNFAVLVRREGKRAT